MDVTMTTKDPVGKRGCERTSLEQWKLVIRWNCTALHQIPSHFWTEPFIANWSASTPVNTFCATVSDIELDELKSRRMTTNWYGLSHPRVSLSVPNTHMHVYAHVCRRTHGLVCVLHFYCNSKPVRSSLEALEGNRKTAVADSERKTNGTQHKNAFILIVLQKTSTFNLLLTHVGAFLKIDENFIGLCCRLTFTIFCCIYFKVIMVHSTLSVSSVHFSGVKRPVQISLWLLKWQLCFNKISHLLGGGEL